MSIFGERIAHPGPSGRGPNMVEVLSDYAKKDYVDEQLSLRVLKTGDTMTGDLKMAGGGGGGGDDSRAAPDSTYWYDIIQR